MAKLQACMGEITEDLSVDIVIDNLKLLTSGIVFTTNGKPITIELDDLKLNIRFEEDDSIQTTNFESKYISSKEVDFILTNFNSPLGQGKIQPINLIITDYFDVHLSFYVHKLDKHNQSYQFTYSLLYGEKT